MKRKKGNSLVIVVCMFAILSILIISILALTTGGYKLRKQEAKRIENFYGADSGIEIAHANMQKVVKSAIEEGNDAVIKAMNNQITTYPNGDLIDSNANPAWKNKLFKDTYEKYIKDNLENAIDNVDPPIKLTSPDQVTKIYQQYKKDGKEVQMNARATASVNEWILNSVFTDSENKSREVEVDFEIATPEYGKVLDEGGAIKNKSIFDYVMAIDGNLDINNNGSIHAFGDIWIKGTEPLLNRKDANYKPAIRWANGEQNSVDWNGTIATPGDFYVENAGMKITNIYADNFIYKGKNKALSFENFNLYNDFIFEAENTKLNTKNYYGLNDIDTKARPSAQDLETSVLHWEDSSSIIVNSTDFINGGSKVTVDEDMYVLGTAYLQLEGTDYKTGESMAINRIAEAYTQRTFLDSKLNAEEFAYKYRNPLHLLDQKLNKDSEEYENLNVAEKSEIAEDFMIKSDVKIKGVETKGNVYSSGLMYNNGEIIKPTSSFPKCDQDKHKHKDETNVVACKKNEFASQVFAMGTKLDTPVAEELFKKKKIVSSVSDSFSWPAIQALMDSAQLKAKDGTVLFERIDSYPESGASKSVVKFKSKETVLEIMKKFNGVKTSFDSAIDAEKINIIFNNSGKKIILTDGGNIEDRGSYMNVPIDKDTRQPLIIISKDDIIIKAEGTPWRSYGVFYTEGDLKFDVKSTLTFGNYSVAPNTAVNDLFKELFGGIIDGVTDEGIIDQSSGMNSIINPKDLVKSKNWKLVK